MHELHSLVQCDNKASPFRSVPVNVLPRWSSNRKHRMIRRQTSYKSVDLTEDTGVIQCWPTDNDQRKAEKNQSAAGAGGLGIIRGNKIEESEQRQ